MLQIRLAVPQIQFGVVAGHCLTRTPQSQRLPRQVLEAATASPYPTKRLSEANLQQRRYVKCAHAHHYDWVLAFDHHETLSRNRRSRHECPPQDLVDRLARDDAPAHCEPNAYGLVRGDDPFYLLDHRSIAHRPHGALDFHFDCDCAKDSDSDSDSDCGHDAVDALAAAIDFALVAAVDDIVWNRRRPLTLDWKSYPQS